MIRFIAIAVFLILFLILTLPLLLVEWLIGKVNRRAKDISCLRIVQWTFRVILRITGSNVEVHGLEHIPKDTAVLYVANHSSYFDILLTYVHCPNLTGYVAKKEMLRYPSLNLWMKNLYCLFLDRNDMRAAVKTIGVGIKNIKDGISMCIFPEGTRNKHPETLLPFKEGSLRMAEKTGCPIIPIAIKNSAEIFENHLPKMKPAHISLQYGKPILPKELPKDQQKHLGAYTQKRIEEMLGITAEGGTK